MHIAKNSEKKFSLYNNEQTFASIALESIKDIFTLNFGNALKSWFVDKKLNTLTAEKKNFLLTQKVRKIIVSQKYQDIDITDADNDLDGFVNHLDKFLKKKIKEQVEESVAELFFNTELKLEESTEFDKFVEVASELLRKNQEKKKEIIESAKVLENISYPLTEKYFLCRYVKFMRFGSLILSSKYANKIVKYCTSNELTDDTYFNDFFYNNVARMALAIAPLIVYESTGDVKILSIATAIDVLTTVRSDMKCGDAISMANDFSTKKATNENLRLRGPQNSELQGIVVEQQNLSSQQSQ